MKTREDKLREFRKGLKPRAWSKRGVNGATECRRGVARARMLARIEQRELREVSR
jgi:hypothetical protein